jgi:hypothetical protein
MILSLSKVVFRWLLRNPFNFQPSDILEIYNRQLTWLREKKTLGVRSLSPVLTSHEPDQRPIPNPQSSPPPTRVRTLATAAAGVIVGCIYHLQGSSLGVAIPSPRSIAWSRCGRELAVGRPRFTIDAFQLLHEVPGWRPIVFLTCSLFAS